MARQSREDLWNDDDFQPLNLLGKGSANHPKVSPPPKSDPVFDAHIAKREQEIQKRGEIRKMHREILKEFPTLDYMTHILDEYDTPEKVRKYLVGLVSSLQNKNKPILKKK